MNELFIYLIKAAFINAVLLAFYHFTLRKSNRFYSMRITLLIAMVLPLLFPLIPYPSELQHSSVNIPHLRIVLPVTSIAASEAVDSLNWADFSHMLYYGVSLVLLVGMVISICAIIQKRIRSKQHLTSLGKVELEHSVKSPFSFFSWVFLSPIDLVHPQLDMILKHEFCHVREKHSIDRVLSGIFRSVLWFSPFAHITSRLLSEVHEYQADSKVIGIYDRSDYSDLILSFYLNPNTSSITNNFSLHIKNRINMINNLNSAKFSYQRIAVGLMIVMSAITITSMVTTNDDRPVMNSPLIIDNPDTIRKNQPSKIIEKDLPDSPPQFPGGDKARIEYIAAHTTYPEDARKAGKEGTVYVQFVITPTGEVSSVKVLKSVFTSLDRIAYNAIVNMPKWIPARKGNKAVSYEMTIPIKFELSDGKKDKAYKEANTGDIFSKDNTVPQKQEGSRVFTVVEEAPEFPGGDEARVVYLNNNIIYPEQARKQGIQGTVYITFVVEPDGTITGAKVLRGVGGGLDEVALEVVKNMPKWKPAKVKGEPVPVQFNMPIKFKLSETEKKAE